jgi:hypothetical protein
MRVSARLFSQLGGRARLPQPLFRKESQIAIITKAGELVEKRMRTEGERLRQYFKERPAAKT